VSGARFTIGRTSDGTNAFYYRALVLRLLPDGRKDPTFGASGWANGLAGDGSALLVHNGQVLVGGDLRSRHPTNPYYDDTPPPPGTRLGFRITRFSS
jgi:hypothetical protein